jgi:hypothetical protein
MMHLHDQYASFLARNGQAVSQMGGRNGAFTPDSLASVLNRWGRSQQPPLNLSLGIVRTDYLDDAQHEGLLVVIDGLNGRTPGTISATVWIYQESAALVFDHDAYSRLTVFKGLLKAEPQFGMMAKVRRLTFQSRQIVLRRWAIET